MLDFFTEFLNASDRADHFPRWLSFIRSTDKGASWGKEERVDIEFPGSILAGRDGDSTIDVEPVPCPDPTENGSCPIRSGDFIPDVAVDPRNGNLYAVWMDLRFDGGIFLTDHDNIAFTMSTDGGRTWSPTIKVNQTPTNEPNYDQQAFTPAVDVAGRRDGHRHLLRLPQQHRRARRRSTPTTSPCTATRAAPARRAGPGTRRASRPPRSTSARRPTRGATSWATTWASPRPEATSCRVRPGVHPERLQPVREPARALEDSKPGLDQATTRPTPPRLPRTRPEVGVVRSHAAGYLAGDVGRERRDRAAAHRTLGAGDWRWGRDVFDDECEAVFSASWFPEADNYRVGAEALRAWNGFRDAFETFEVRLDRIIDAGDRVVASTHIQARGQASGAAVDAFTGGIFTLRGGKIVRYVLTDSREALEAVGLPG